MTDFARRLHQSLIACDRQSNVKPSKITRITELCMSEVLQGLMKGFQKRLGKLGDKARQKIGPFVEELRQSKDKIMGILQETHGMVLMAEKEGESSKANTIAKMLEKRLAFHEHKIKILSRNYQGPQEQLQDEDLNWDDQFGYDFDDNRRTYIMKCHTADSLEPCTPENDQKLDLEIRYTLRDLFDSVEKSLSRFQNNFQHIADPSILELTRTLKGEYRRAKEKIKDSSPTIQQIRNIKQLQIMIKATIIQNTQLITQIGTQKNRKG